MIFSRDAGKGGIETAAEKAMAPAPLPDSARVGEATGYTLACLVFPP
jgi:hypothetical protein